MTNTGIYSYNELVNDGYTGTAYNVFYEYQSEDGEIWGHNGEYADEFDYWFKDEQVALDFCQQHLSSSRLIEMLKKASDDVYSISSEVMAYEWEDGDCSFMGDESYFLVISRDDIKDLA